VRRGSAGEGAHGVSSHTFLKSTPLCRCRIAVVRIAIQQLGDEIGLEKLRLLARIASGGLRKRAAFGPWTAFTLPT
jgi:hypothetical protein